MSALFFSDDYIDARAELPKEQRVILYLKKQDSVFFSFVNEIKKIMLSLLFGFILCLIFEKLSKIPEEVENNLNDELRQKDKKKILKAQ